MEQPNPDLVAGLRAEVLQYKDVDDQIRTLNRQIYQLRDQRDAVKDRIIHIIEQPGFQRINELAISQDGSKIRIRRPRSWSSAWSLSKSRLQALLTEYFATPGLKSADQCYDYIHFNIGASLVQEKFAIERTVPGGADE
jgi:hypothetical protein